MVLSGMYFSSELDPRQLAIVHLCLVIVWNVRSLLLQYVVING